MIMTDYFLKKAVEQQISEGESVTLRVTGRSMRPYLSGTGNELVVVSKHKSEELKLGVIILFSYNDRFVFHRILNKVNDRLVVQGDGNCVDTENILTKNVLGIVRYIIRPEGKQVSPYSFSARIHWQIWYRLRPIRKYLLFIYNRLHP